ncbi:hypothetical protein IT568_00920 [bacterium]|nr:hypothetical protein [bacterium]
MEESFNFDLIIENFCDTLKDEFPEIIIEPTFENESGEDVVIDIYAPSDLIDTVEFRASELVDEIEASYDISLSVECHNIDEF